MDTCIPVFQRRVIWIFIFACIVMISITPTSRHQAEQSPVSVRPIPVVMPHAELDVHQIQNVAVVLQLCPAGKIDSVEMDISRGGDSPSLKVVIHKEDGSIIHIHTVLKGLQVETPHSGIIRLQKVSSSTRESEIQ